MFDSKHYIPILKWKRAEQGALEVLTNEAKEYITPLIQFVMPRQKPQDDLDDVVARFKKQLTQIPDRIIEVWGNKSIYIDFSLLFTTELKIESLKSIIMTGHQKNILLIPVVHLNDDLEIVNTVCALAEDTKSGLCLRLVAADLFDLKKLNNNIIEFISGHKLKEEYVDLLVDIKELESNEVTCKQYFDLSQNIINLLKWRTFIFSGSSFPQDLSGCKRDEETLIPRIGWNIWKDQYKNSGLCRNPSFSDYVIQYPIYNEISQFFPSSASIKYTLENEWLIMKGQKQKFEQYLAHAALLVNDNRYYGENFSFGDKYINSKAKHFSAYIKKPELKGTGSTETWLRAGINHHMTLVATQIAKLS